MNRVSHRLCAAVVLAVGMVLTALPASAASDSVSYTYDTLGRVTRMAYANGTSVVYSYDAAGNRTGAVTTCSASGC
jgi:YD repeat-containing protein